MDSLCYNCYKKGHLSINCPDPPKHTRCFLCKRVCETADDHYWACTNREFISQPIEQPGLAMRSATLVADLKISTKAI